jgi:pimeloyl-ACP methyl ester carboxylesterase
MLVETSDGTLECLTAGQTGAGSVVLVHGIQGTASVWKPVMGSLSTNRHVIAPNLRGRAGSFSPDTPESYTLSNFACDLHSVINTISGPVLLIGWSMGGFVALEYLTRFGTGRLIGLGLISSSPCIKATAGIGATWFKGETSEELALDAIARAERLQLTETATHKAVAGSWMSVSMADYRAMLSAISLPVLVLHGADDGECPVEHGRALAAGIPNAALDVWDGCGHVPMSFDPGRFAEKLNRFVLDCERRGGTLRSKTTEFQVS